MRFHRERGFILRDCMDLYGVSMGDPQSMMETHLYRARPKVAV
jgi:hypothetical protein